MSGQGNHKHRRCIVCAVKSSSTQRSFFKVPTDEKKRKKWLSNLLITYKLLGNVHYVCENHFDPKNVLSGSPPVMGENGKVLIESVPYKTKRLRPDAEPLLVTRDASNSSRDNHLPTSNSNDITVKLEFDSFESDRQNSFLSESNSKHHENSRSSIADGIEYSAEHSASPTSDSNGISVKIEFDSFESEDQKSFLFDSNSQDRPALPSSDSDGVFVKEEFRFSRCELQDLNANDSDSQKDSKSSLYCEIVPILNKIMLPSPKWNWHLDTESKIVIFLSYSFIKNNTVLREVIVPKSGTIKANVFGKKIDLHQLPESIEELSSLIKGIDKMRVCCGYPPFHHFKNGSPESGERKVKVTRHENCLYVIGDGDACAKCAPSGTPYFYSFKPRKKREN